MYEDKEIFSRNGHTKPRMAWSDVRRKRLEKKAWGKSESQLPFGFCLTFDCRHKLYTIS